MKTLPLLALAGCAPFITAQDIEDRADPCAWDVAQAAGTLLAAQTPCDGRWVLSGTGRDDAFGGTLAAVGDLDGDGAIDLAVGSPGANGGHGAVHVFSATTLAQRPFLHVQDADHALLGASAGDAAGYVYTSLDSRDGVAGRELVVAAPHNDAGGQDAGAVYMVTTVDLQRGARLPLGQVATRFLGGSRDTAGTALAVVDSSDDDGLQELVVSAPHATLLAASSGALFVVHSRVADLNETTLLREEASSFGYITADSEFGHAMATYDGDPHDGYASGLLVGAPLHPNHDWNLWDMANWGRGWLFGDDTVPPPHTALEVLEPYSALAVNLRAETTFSFEEEEIRWRDAEERMGSAVAVVPDMDGGGWDEPVLGGLVNEPGDIVAFVIRGEDTVGQLGGIFLIEQRAAVRILGGEVGPEFVPVISGVHDLDGDGLGELLIGDPTRDANGVLDVGRVYVFTSGQLFPGDAEGQITLTLGDAAHTIDGRGPGARFGASIAEVGDLDGDGRPEIAIGAPGDTDGEGEPVGRVTVFGVRL